MDYSELDPLVIPMVKYFNENGLKTFSSCQGHDNLSMFYIQFDDDVTDEDIQNFMRNHLDGFGWFSSYGYFMRRMACGYNIRHKEWNRFDYWGYFAKTPEAAAKDLNRWKNKEELWDGFDGENYKKHIALFSWKFKE